MNQATFGDKDLLTVGAWGNSEIAERTPTQKIKNLSMVFQFEHIVLQYQPRSNQKWRYAKGVDVVPKLKEIFTKWQTELGRRGGWNSSFGTTTIYLDCPLGGWWGLSCQICQRLCDSASWWGTPYIYRGRNRDDNYHWTLEDVEDIESINYAPLKP